MTSPIPETETWDDVELVARVRERHDAALREFTRRMSCVPRFLTCRNQRFGRPLGTHDLQDLAQDVLVLIWGKLPTFRGEASLETWAYRFCDLQLRNAVRRRRRREGDLASENVADVATNAPPDVEPATGVHDAFAGLTGTDAQILREKHFEERTFQQIAQRVGESTNTVKSRYYRALERLRAALKRRSEERDDG